MVARSSRAGGAETPSQSGVAQRSWEPETYELPDLLPNNRLMARCARLKAPWLGHSCRLPDRAPSRHSWSWRDRRAQAGRLSRQEGCRLRVAAWRRSGERYAGSPMGIRRRPGRRAPTCPSCYHRAERCRQRTDEARWEGRPRVGTPTKTQGVAVFPLLHGLGSAGQPLLEPLGEVVDPIRGEGLAPSDPDAAALEVYIGPHEQPRLTDPAPRASHEGQQVSRCLPLAPGSGVGGLTHKVVCMGNHLVAFLACEGSAPVPDGGLLAARRDRPDAARHVDPDNTPPKTEPEDAGRNRQDLWMGVSGGLLVGC